MRKVVKKLKYIINEFDEDIAVSLSIHWNSYEVDVERASKSVRQEFGISEDDDGIIFQYFKDKNDAYPYLTDIDFLPEYFFLPLEKLIKLDKKLDNITINRTETDGNNVVIKVVIDDIIL